MFHVVRGCCGQYITGNIANTFKNIKRKEMEKKEKIELYCNVHPTEIIIAFCDTCQKAVCFECSRDVHKEHKCYKMENKAVESRNKIPKICALIHSKKIPELQNSLDKIKMCKTQVSKTDEVIEKIHKRANELMAIIMEERDLLIEQCKTSQLSQEKYYQIAENVTRKYIDLYNASLHEADDVVKSTNTIEVVLFERKLNNQIRDFKPKSLISHSVPKFKTGKTDRTAMKTMVGTVPCDNNLEDMASRAEELVGIQTKLVSSIRYSSKNIASISFQDNDKAWMYPVESTVGAIVDIKGTEHKRFDFGIELSDMTVTNKNIILATDTVNKRIVRITNNGIVKEIVNTTPLQPHGLCACKNGDLLVTQIFKTDPKAVDSKRLVHRLDKEYKIKLTIQYTDSFFNKKHILTHPRRVTENLNGDIIVVDLLGETSGRVVAFDFVGNLRFTYEGNPRRFKFLPFDICCEPELRISVSDFYNHEINVLNCDGEFIQEIPTNLEGLFNPIAIALDKTNKLWIGGKGGKILVYKYT